MGNMNRIYFYANWKQGEIATKAVISVQNFEVVTSFFVNLGLILLYWEMFQIALDFMCLISGYGSYYKWKG